MFASFPFAGSRKSLLFLCLTVGSAVFFPTISYGALVVSQTSGSASDTLPDTSHITTGETLTSFAGVDKEITQIRIPIRNSNTCVVSSVQIKDGATVIGTGTQSQNSTVSSYNSDSSTWRHYDFSPSVLIESGTNYDIQVNFSSCPYSGGTRGYTHYYSGTPAGTRLYASGSNLGRAIFEIYGDEPELSFLSNQTSDNNITSNFATWLDRIYYAGSVDDSTYKEIKYWLFDSDAQTQLHANNSNQEPFDMYTSFPDVFNSAFARPEYASTTYILFTFADGYNTVTDQVSYAVFSIDSGNVYAIDNYGSTTAQIEPDPERTYVSSFLPVDNSYVYSTTSVSTAANYRVDSSDVNDTNNVYIQGTWTSIKQTLTSSDQQEYSGAFQDQVFIFDDEQTFANLFDSPATGTIQLSYEIYERQPQTDWWNPLDWIVGNDQSESYTLRTLARDSVEFYLYDITEASEIATLREQFQQEQEQLILAQQTPCSEQGNLSQACMVDTVDSTVSAILHAKPIGYATRIYEIFSATSTPTTTLALAMTFPTSSPASGMQIDLDISNTVEDAINSINNDYPVKDMYDEAMIYWNWFWYLLLAFWIIGQILGTFQFDFNYDINEEHSNNSRSRNKPYRKPPRTLDMKSTNRHRTRDVNMKV